VTQKTSKAKPRPPTLSKSLKVKAGPTAVQKVLKQNLRKIAIYETSQDQQQEAFHRILQGEDGKMFTNMYYNQHHMSSSTPATMHETCINIRTEHQTNI